MGRKRHTPSSYPIRIGGTREDGYVALPVSDEGRGIEPDQVSTSSGSGLASRAAPVSASRYRRGASKCVGLSRVIRAERPGLVLLDLMLPGTDGIEFHPPSPSVGQPRVRQRRPRPNRDQEAPPEARRPRPQPHVHLQPAWRRLPYAGAGQGVAGRSVAAPFRSGAVPRADSHGWCPASGQPRTANGPWRGSARNITRQRRYVAVSNRRSRHGLNNGIGTSLPIKRRS